MFTGIESATVKTWKSKPHKIVKNMHIIKQLAKWGKQIEKSTLKFSKKYSWQNWKLNKKTPQNSRQKKWTLETLKSHNPFNLEKSKQIKLTK